MKLLLPSSLLALLCLTSSLALAQGPAPSAEQLAELQQQTDTATKQLHNYLNQLGYNLLLQRAATVSAITTRAQAEQRQQLVKQRITDLVGGIPATQGKVKVKNFGSVQDDGFRIDKLMYESVKDYWVTADLYVPNGKGPFPALVIAPGHGAGKSSSHNWAANFAANGYVVLSIDPMGQGERMQHWDAELGNSKLEGSGEHEHANQSALLVGKHIARYWFADGIRGVDMLQSRSDVDAQRIGTFGCSGGGTAAAYLAAMDSRVKAAAVASFITSFKELLPGNGPQDAEQTLPGFIANGLDFADWVELAAPRPLAIIAFKQDFFPFAGAQQTYDEAARFYQLFNANDAVKFIGGEGGHCNLGPVTPQVVSFLDSYLKPNGPASAAFTTRTPKNSDDLLVTPTGQLATSTDSKTVEQLLRSEVAGHMVKHAVLKNGAESDTLWRRVRDDIVSLNSLTADKYDPPKAEIIKREQRDGYVVETLSIHTDIDVTLPVILAIPDGVKRPTLLIRLESTPLAQIAASAEFAQQVKNGYAVALFQPRGVLGDIPTTQLALGPYMPNLLRAVVVNKTLMGLRIDDTLQLIEVLPRDFGLQDEWVTLYGKGALGLVALHVSVIRSTIKDLIVENMLVSYQSAFEAGLHKNLSEVVIPGVLQHYDTVELLQASNAVTITLLNPVNAMGQRLPNDEATRILTPVLQSDKRLEQPARIKIQRRAPGEKLPLSTCPIEVSVTEHVFANYCP